MKIVVELGYDLGSGDTGDKVGYAHSIQETPVAILISNLLFFKSLKIFNYKENLYVSVSFFFKFSGLKSRKCI